MGLLERLRRHRPITPAAAAAGVEAGDLLLVDVREASEFASGHAPGARHVPLSRVADAMSDLAQSGQPIAFICRSGARSAVATRRARASGLDAVNVRGGMLAWERSGLTTRSGRR